MIEILNQSGQLTMNQEFTPPAVAGIIENKVTLEQWRAFLAVVDAGGYARAAEVLNKSQSSVSYAVAQLEAALDVKVFQLQGRKAVATPAGDRQHRLAPLAAT